MENFIKLTAADVPKWVVEVLDEVGEHHVFNYDDVRASLKVNEATKFVASIDAFTFPGIKGRNWLAQTKMRVVMIDKRQLAPSEVATLLNVLGDAYFGRDRTATERDDALAAMSAHRRKSIQLPDYAEKGYDFSGIMDGRFGINFGGKWRFVAIKTLKRGRKFNGRYRWTKFPWKNQHWLNAGDRIFQEQRGDTWELIGFQVAGEPSYRGDEETLVGKILANPNQAQWDYSEQTKRCFYCSKSLTDEESVARKIGPECWEEKHVVRLLWDAERVFLERQNQSVG